MRAQIGKADIKKGKEKDGRFSVLRFYAAHKREFPIHFILALVFFSCLNSEANVELVFSYAGGVMDKKRASLSAVMLEAMVFVAQNAKFFPFTTEELYDKYYGMFAGSFAVDAPEEDDNEESDDDGEGERA